jgi:hypothetical protein
VTVTDLPICLACGPTLERSGFWPCFFDWGVATYIVSVSVAVAPAVYAVLRGRQHSPGWGDPDRRPDRRPVLAATLGVPPLLWLIFYGLDRLTGTVDPGGRSSLCPHVGLCWGFEPIGFETAALMSAAVARFALTLAWWPVVTFVVRPPRGHFRTALTETAWLSWALFVAVALLPFGVDLESRELAGWLFVLSLAAAGWAWWRFDRPDPEGRFAEGRCRGCAYDLTGNVTGTCPECGRPVAGPDATAEAPSQL